MNTPGRARTDGARVLGAAALCGRDPRATPPRCLTRHRRSICVDLHMPQAVVAVGHVVRLEPLPAEHTARSCLQLRPLARWAAAHAPDRTERDLDDPVPRVAQSHDG